MAKKRSQNEGSLFQRPSGKWQARVMLSDGKRHSFVIDAPTKRDALVQLRAKQLEMDSGIAVDLGTQTVEQFLTSWLRDVVTPSVRSTTLVSYESLIRVYIIPALGHIQLTKLTAQHVQTLLNKVSAQGKSPRTVQYIRSILRAALAQAVKWSILPRNVAGLTTPPRRNQQEVRPLNPEQVQVLIEAARTERLGPLFVVTTALGLRQGEALGLQWRDIDLDQGFVRVERALIRVQNVPTFADPKTEKSRRTLVLPELAKEFLLLQRSINADLELLAGDRWEDWGLVFPSTIGTPLNPSNVTNYLRQFMVRLELPHQRFHDLRHCCASLLLAEGVPARVVMEILGHSQISLTLNTYSHVMPKALDEAASAIDRAMSRS